MPDLKQTLRRTLLLLLPVLLFLAAIGASGQIPTDRRVTARLLVRIASGASHRLLQASQARPPGLDARAVAFQQALLRMDAQLQQVAAGLRTRDLAFFQALRNGTAALAELQVSWSLTGRRDAAIEQDLTTLAVSYDRLRDRYGPEWLRYQTGQPLNDDERIRFARMRGEQSFLAGRLEVLRDQAEQAGDRATAEELQLLVLQARGIATAPPTLGDYLDASVAADAIRGGWYAARSGHGVDEEEWAEADQVVSDITTDNRVGFVFSTDLSSVRDWSFVDEETEVPEEIAQAAEAVSQVPELEPGQILELAEEPDESDLPPLPDDDPDAEEQLPAEEIPGDEAIEEEDLSADAASDEEAPKDCAPEDLACEEEAGPAAQPPLPAPSPQPGEAAPAPPADGAKAPVPPAPPAPAPPPAAPPGGCPIG